MESFTQFLNQYVISPIRGMSLVDLLDIILLAMLIYYVYRFIWDRRAGKLAVGVGLIIFAFILASVLEMHATSFILQNFYQVGIMALIVIFQPELRAVLEKVGATPMTSLKSIAAEKSPEQITEAVEAITEAVCDLSREKTGALIVIERSTKLGEYIKSGVVINAQASSHLLRNLFYNKAPLHDGAVIIRDYRVYAAGCFLPLSTQSDIVKDLGTRHRAAIGMSEASDAPVIVVSEETGTISVAFEGALKRNFNYATLKEELLSILDPQNSQKTPKNPLPRRLVRRSADRVEQTDRHDTDEKA